MMPTGDDESHEVSVDGLLTELPPEDLRPTAGTRIEAACLARLRRRRTTFQVPVSLLGALEAILALLLGGTYLLSMLSWALALYGLHFR
jgi:hypothetical protein